MQLVDVGSAVHRVGHLECLQSLLCLCKSRHCESGQEGVLLLYGLCSIVSIELFVEGHVIEDLQLHRNECVHVVHLSGCYRFSR